MIKIRMAREACFVRSAGIFFSVMGQKVRKCFGTEQAVVSAGQGLPKRRRSIRYVMPVEIVVTGSMKQEAHWL